MARFPLAPGGQSTDSDQTGGGGGADSDPFAPLASPAFTGTPTAPTQTFGDNTTKIATDAFVQAAVSGSVAGVASYAGRTGIVVPTSGDLTTMGGAPIASPTFTGTPAAPTQSPGDNSTKLATTAYVAAAGSGGGYAPPWQVIESPQSMTSGPVGAATFVFGFLPTLGSTSLGAYGTGLWVFTFDPADYLIAGRTSKVRLHSWVLTNPNAPGVTFTFALNPVTAWMHYSGYAPVVSTIGAAVVSNVIASPPASSAVLATSSVANAPTAGWYVLTVTTSGSLGSSVWLDVGCRLQLQQQ